METIITIFTLLGYLSTVSWVYNVVKKWYLKTKTSFTDDFSNGVIKFIPERRYIVLVTNS